MGLGEVKAPRALSVPARKVLHSPDGSSLWKRLIGSVEPAEVPMKRCMESGV